MKKWIALLLCMVVLAPCAMAEETAVLPFPAMDEAVFQAIRPTDESDFQAIRLTDEGHYLFVLADMALREADAEGDDGYRWEISDGLLDIAYRCDPDEGLTLADYAEQLCGQEGFAAESLRVQNVDCFRLTPQDSNEGFFALLWVARAGEICQLQFAYPMDTDDGYTLAENIMRTLGRYELPADADVPTEPPAPQP